MTQLNIKLERPVSQAGSMLKGAISLMTGTAD